MPKREPLAPMTAPQNNGAVRSPKTAEIVADTLRRMIVEGQLKDGDFLPYEAELMDHFQVSRPSLREAVRVLESDRLVEVRRGSRTGRVRSMTAFMTLKMAVLTPMPRASVNTATAVKPGLRRNCRAPRRRFCDRISTFLQPHMARLASARQLPSSGSAAWRWRRARPPLDAGRKRRTPGSPPVA